MPAIATVNANNTSYTVVDTVNGTIHKKTYALSDTRANFVHEPNGDKSLYLFTGEILTVAVSTVAGNPYTGNSIFGATTPDAAQTAVESAIGRTATGGGGGGGGTADSTAALQTAGNTSLAAIDLDTTAIATSTAATSTTATSINTNATAINTATAATSTTATQINNKIVADQKITIAGAAGTGTAVNNLLDPGTGINSTDVTSYRSAQITIVTSAAALSYAIRGAIQTGFSSGVIDLQTVNPTTGAIAASAVTQPASTTAVYLVDLSTANFLRVPAISGGNGALVTAIFSKLPISQLRHVQILDPLEKQFYEREAGSVATAIARYGGLAPSTSDFFIGNTKICRFTFVNFNPFPLYATFFNSATALISGVAIPATNEAFPVIGGGQSQPGILFLADTDWDKSGNWGVNSRVGISTTRNVYTAPSAAVMAQTSLNIETTPLV